MATKGTAEATMSPKEKAKVDNARSCEQQATPFPSRCGGENDMGTKGQTLKQKAYHN
jgi:hypothetical protein